MRTLNIEKTEKPKRFAKTKQFLACTLLSAGLIFGSGCKEKTEEQPMVIEQVIKQEINMKEKSSMSKFKLNRKGNLEIQMNKGDSFFLPGIPLTFDRSRKRHNSNISGFEVILNDKNEIKVRQVSILHTPQRDGKELLDSTISSRFEKVIINEGESYTFKYVFPLVQGRPTIKNLGDSKFEICFKTYGDKEFSFTSKELILNGGLFINGNEYVSGTRKRVDGFSTNTNIYTNKNGDLVLSKQKINWEELDFCDGKYDWSVAVGEREKYLKGWLKRNKYVNIMGNKFEVNYLIKNEKLTSEQDDDIYKGTFCLTNVKTKEKIYVSNNLDTIDPFSKAFKKYSKEVTIDGKTYEISINNNRTSVMRHGAYVSRSLGPIDSITGFSIELKH